MGLNKTRPDFEAFETTLAANGYICVCGVDEAGRGPLAGPVYAAAVVLPPSYDLPFLNDSKKLSEKKRETLFSLITQQAVSYAIAQASAEEIGEINILNAALLAMRRAAEALPCRADFALIDGNRAPVLEIPSQTLVRGDSRCASIAAASILAKVTRDRVMIELDAIYPGYGFAVHKGYPTKAHYEALARLGPSPAHRRGFRLA